MGTSPAYCKSIVVKFSQDENGNPLDIPRTVTLDVGKILEKSITGTTEEFVRANNELDAASDDLRKMLGGSGVSFELALSKVPFLQVLYVPILKKKNDRLNDNLSEDKIDKLSMDDLHDIAEGKMDPLMVKSGLTGSALATEYEKCLGWQTTNEAGHREYFNVADERVFDRSVEEPRIEFTKGVSTFHYMPARVSEGGFSMAAVRAWRKVFVPLDANGGRAQNSNSIDFLYMVEDDRSRLSGSRTLSYLKFKSWWKTNDCNYQNPDLDPANYADSGGANDAVKWNATKGALRETSDYLIMALKCVTSAAAGAIDWLGIISRLAPAGLALSALANNGDEDITNNIYGNAIPIEYYVLPDSVMKKDYKAGEYANFSKKYDEWAGKWQAWNSSQQGDGKLLFYGEKSDTEKDIKVSPGAVNFVPYEGKGVKITFDGRWSCLPAPPEYCSQEKGDDSFYADDFYGRFNFENKTFGKVAVSKEIAEGAKVSSEVAKSAVPLSADNWKDSLIAGGTGSVPSLKSVALSANQDPDAVMRMYAMYSMKFYVGYYVYDYSLGRWLRLDDGDWMSFGDNLPKVNNAENFSGRSANGNSTVLYEGGWLIRETAPEDFSIDSALMLDKEGTIKTKTSDGTTSTSKIESISATELEKKTVAGPTFVYAAYKSQEMRFKWYTFAFNENSSDEGKWQEYHTSDPCAISEEAISIDFGFVSKIESEKKNALDLLDGKYIFTGDWVLLTENKSAPSGILGIADADNYGSRYDLSKFKNNQVKTNPDSNMATYCFYAVYKEAKSFDVKFYVLDPNSQNISWKELDPPEDNAWSKVLSGGSGDEDKTEFNIPLPNPDEIGRAKLKSADFKGTFAFANCWLLLDGKGTAEGSDLSSGSKGIDVSGLGYEISYEKAKKPNASEEGSESGEDGSSGMVSGVVDDKNKNLVLQLDDSVETTLKLYAVYDKVYSVRFNLLGDGKMPEDSGAAVNWNEFFTAEIKDGDEISKSIKNADGKTLEEILKDSSLILSPQWNLSEGDNYERKYWFNVSSPAEMGSISYITENLFRSSSGLNVSAYWDFEEGSSGEGEGADSGSGAKKATAFNANEDKFKYDADGNIWFYPIYLNSKKKYEVVFYVPSAETDGDGNKKLVWKKAVVSEGRVGFGEGTVPIDQPDIKEFESVELDIDGYPKGKYKFAGLWGRDASGGWNSAVSLRKNANTNGKEIGKNVISTDYDLLEFEEDKNEIELVLDDNDEDTAYALYAAYDKVFEVEFFLVSDAYEEIPSEGGVKWNSVFTVELKEGDQLLGSEDHDKLGNDVDSLFDSGDASVKPIWGREKGKFYNFTRTWYNPSDSDDMENSEQAGKLCFAPDKEDSLFGNCWDLTDTEDDEKAYATKGAFKFEPYGADFKIKSDFPLNFSEDGKLRFYGVYAITQRDYSVIFKVPEIVSEDGKQSLGWKDALVVTGEADYDAADFDVKLPNTKDFEKITLSFDDPLAGNYEFSNLWILGSEKGEVEWNSSYRIKNTDESKTQVENPVDKISEEQTWYAFPSGADQVKGLMDTDKQLTEYVLYAVFDKVFDVEFYLVDTDKGAKPSSGNVSWSNVFSASLKEGAQLSLDVLKDGSSLISAVISNLFSSKSSMVKPVWDREGGKTYAFTNTWYSPSEYADMEVPDKVSAHCFAENKEDELFKDCWDLTGKAQDEKAYPTKGAFEFLPYSSDFALKFDADGKLKLYGAYVPSDAVQCVFYVVKDFVQEEFTWKPYAFKATGESSELEVHEIEIGSNVADPNSLAGYEIKDLESSKIKDGGTLASGKKNKLVFKGWRRIDPDTEFNQNAPNDSKTDVLTLFDVSADGSKALMYDCACQKEAKKDSVKKSGFYWDEGTFPELQAKDEDMTKPFAFVAVYEYQQTFESVETVNPEYDNVKYDYSGSFAYGSTSAANRLYDANIGLGAGRDWNMSVTRNRYTYNSRLKKLILANSDTYSAKGNGSCQIEMNLDKDVSVFSTSQIEIGTWWIENPSGYVAEVSFVARYNGGGFTQPKGKTDSDEDMPKLG